MQSRFTLLWTDCLFDILPEVVNRCHQLGNVNTRAILGLLLHHLIRTPEIGHLFLQHFDCFVQFPLLNPLFIQLPTLNRQLCHQLIDLLLGLEMSFLGSILKFQNRRDCHGGWVFNS